MRSWRHLKAALGVWSSHFLVHKRIWVFMVSAEIQEVLGEVCSWLAGCGGQALPRTPTSGSLPGLTVKCILNSHPLQQRGNISPVAAEQTSLQRPAKDPRAALQGKCSLYRNGLVWFLLLVTGEWSGFLQQTLSQALISNSNMCFHSFNCERKTQKPQRSLTAELSLHVTSRGRQDKSLQLYFIL